MKRILLAVLLLGTVSTSAWAGGITNAANSSTTHRITATVYNDSGSTLVSGAPVVWDHDDTEYDNTGYPYITTTTTADDAYTAGVMLTDSCESGELCEIVTAGWAPARVSVATLSEDTIVGTSTTASSIGDSGELTNGCHLGTLISYTEVGTGNACTSSQVCLVPVQVNVSCGQ